MSIKLMSDAWSTPLPAMQKLVLLAIADCANDEGLAWPSVATIAKKSGCNERTVQRNLRALEEAGLLIREEVLGKGCRYWLKGRQKVTPGAKSPAAQTPKTPGRKSPKPSRTIICFSNEKHTREDGWIEIPDWVPVESWNAYLKMRKRIGKWPTDDAVRLVIGKLDRWRSEGHDPGDILDSSTESNWTGVFQPKAAAPPRQAPSNSNTLKLLREKMHGTGY